MTDHDASRIWEDGLNQDLAKLIAPSPERGPDHAPASAPPADRYWEHDGRSVSIRRFRMEFSESIRNGMALPVDIYDESGTLLLAAGSRVTKQFVALLRGRGVARVWLRAARRHGVATERDEPGGAGPKEGLYTPQSRLLDERAAGELSKPVVFRPVRAWRRPRLSIDDLKEEATDGVERHAATSTAIADLCAKLKPGERMSVTELHRSVTHFVDAASADFDLLPLIVAMQRSSDEYLYDHCVNVSLLSVAMASGLGLDRERIMEVGLGGLVQDIGMLRVPRSIRLAPRGLTGREWHEIHRHPLHTLDMLADLRGIPQTVKFIGYQSHERVDGTGYPCRRSDRQLHECAKIVAIADGYAAMTCKRPYRPALSPYQAARSILDVGATNKFDRRLVRAFLDTVSLFPIGSRVDLSSGATARVLRANPDLHTRPVVEELATDGTPTGHVIDLSNEDELRVVAAT